MSERVDWAVEATALEKRYGAVRALAGLDLRVAEGLVYGVIGPNGAGKTTLLGILSGFLRPGAGVVRVFGRQLPQRRKDLLGRIGVLPQGARLPGHESVSRFLVDCARLLALTPDLAKEAAHEALLKTGMRDEAGARIGTLSHGQARRVGLAQAFLGEPELVLLDEPTDGLDPRAAALVRRTIDALSGRSTILVSSHNLAELESLCDRAAILRGGAVVDEGDMAVLTRSHAEVRFVLAGGWTQGTDREKVETLRQGIGDHGSVRAIDWTEGADALVVSFDPNDIGTIPSLLRILLDAGAPVLEVRRGRGLEAAVLDVT